MGEVILTDEEIANLLRGADTPKAVAPTVDTTKVAIPPVDVGALLRAVQADQEKITSIQGGGTSASLKQNEVDKLKAESAQQPPKSSA